MLINTPSAASMENSVSVGFKVRTPQAREKAGKRARLRRLNHGVIRCLDLMISLSALIFLAPAIVVIALLIRFQDGGPALYRQKRIGLNGREFSCFKLRSMHVRSDEILREILLNDPVARAEWDAEQKLKNDPRITVLGRILRKTSVDELPQLLNVIRGEMSLVGPRPIVNSEVVKYGRSFKNYVSVLPGITGLWQVMGRNDVSYSRRVAMDRLFARKHSCGIYIMILVKTLPAVLLQKGSY
ncbi:sugar transferase [Asticcacaulis sp. SL142]|jgi:exopolysaccharide production protein ExoY|uniref:sugar transferase n=1 Tax=Asticcacaulis sp. SL142 TaxID=2995155 RepID=UPI00226D14BA|nr:sugar transferase [Asticcacaulis sp. SL142]WAC47022.1 sugar transferase [Asticcacaulis sp. SL142]